MITTMTDARSFPATTDFDSSPATEEGTTRVWEHLAAAAGGAMLVYLVGRIALALVAMGAAI